MLQSWQTATEIGFCNYGCWSAGLLAISGKFIKVYWILMRFFFFLKERENIPVFYLSS